MLDVYVDVDGTLLSNELDQQFVAHGYDVAWYDTQYVDTLAVNYVLVHTLRALKQCGYRLILWTNRGTTQASMTRSNLGEVWNLFDEHQFHCGSKHGTNVDGFTFDNEEKYIYSGQLISW